jgi:hypothetical protein
MLHCMLHDMPTGVKGNAPVADGGAEEDEHGDDRVACVALTAPYARC